MKSNFLKKIFSLLTISLALILIVLPLAEVWAEDVVTAEPKAKGFERIFADDAWEQALTKMKTPLAIVGEATFELGPNMMMDANIARTINNLALEYKYALDMIAEPKMLYDMRLYNSAHEDAQGLRLLMYTVKNSIVMDLPGLLDMPIVMQQSDLNMTANQLAGLDPNIISYPVDYIENMEKAAEEMRTAWESFLNNFTDMGASTLPFNLDGLQENLQVETQELSAGNLKPVLQEFLGKIKASEAIMAMLDTSVVDYNLPLLESAEQDEDSEDLDSDTPPQSFSEKLDQMIKELEDDESLEDISLKFLKYADAEGKTRGYCIDFVNSDNVELLSYEGFYLKDESGKVTPATFIIKAQDEDGQIQPILNCLIKLEETDAEVYEGSFKVDLGDSEDTLSGSFTDLHLVEMAEAPEGLIGNFDFDVKISKPRVIFDDGSDSDDVEDLDNEDDTDNYKIKTVTVETLMNFKIDSTQISDEEIDISIIVTPDKKLEGQYVKVNLKNYVKAASEIEIPQELPEKAYDLSKEEDQEALNNNQEIAERLFDIISEFASPIPVEDVEG